MSGEGAARKAIEAVWRIESARLIGGLVRMVRDIGLAEDLAQEALVNYGGDSGVGWGMMGFAVPKLQGCA